MQHLVSTACAAALRQQHWGQSNKSTYCSDRKVLIQ
jgi:hypothetical protein